MELPPPPKCFLKFSRLGLFKLYHLIYVELRQARTHPRAEQNYRSSDLEYFLPNPLAVRLSLSRPTSLPTKLFLLFLLPVS